MDCPQRQPVILAEPEDAIHCHCGHLSYPSPPGSGGCGDEPAFPEPSRERLGKEKAEELSACRQVGGSADPEGGTEVQLRVGLALP